MGGGTVTDYPMGFAQYRAMKAQEEQEQAAALKSEKEEAEKRRREEKKDRARENQAGSGKQRQSVKRQLVICEREIAKAEERLSELDAAIEENARDYEKLTELAQERETAEAELNGLYERWEQLSEEAGE